MADGVENIVYAVKAEGAEQTAKQFAGVAAAQQASQKAAQQLSQELKAAGRTAAAESRVAERAWKEQERAAKQSAREQAKAAREQAKAAREQAREFKKASREAVVAAQSQQRAMATAGGGFKDFSAYASKSVLILGSFTTAAQGAIPGINGMGASISRAGGVINNMTQILGGAGIGGRAGLIGAIVGGAVAAVGLLSNAFKSQKEQADEAKQALTDWLEEAKAVADAADQLALANRSPAETARLVAAQERRDSAARAGLASSGFFSGANASTSPISYGTRADYGTDDAGRPFASNEEAGEYIKRKEREAAAKKPSGKPAPVNLFASGGALESDLRGRDQLSAAITAEQARSKDALSRYDKILRATSPEGQAQRAEQRAAQEREQAKLRAQSAESSAEVQRVLAGEDANEKARTDRLAREWAKRDKLVTDHHDLLRNSAHEAWSMVGASAGAALAALAAGQKVALAEVLGSLGQQLVASGTGHVFEGIFQSLLLNPLGPEMVAIGTAEAAFGASLAAAGGGASRAASAGTGAGGGGASPTYSQTNTVDRSGERFELHIHSGEPPSQEYIVRTYRGLQQAARNGLIPRLAEAS